MVSAVREDRVMCDLRLRLRPLRIDDEAVALAAHRELAEERFAFLLGWGDPCSWQEYVETKHANAVGERLPPSWVPNSFLLAEAAGEVLGRVSVRHRLNEELLHEGGHIGIDVRPQHRGRGVGVAMLTQALIIARSLGVDRVLVTCDDDNGPSAAMIERCGGVLQNKVSAISGDVLVRRYWVE
jgi:predicted acetyltransferase